MMRSSRPLLLALVLAFASPAYAQTVYQDVSSHVPTASPSQDQVCDRERLDTPGNAQCVPFAVIDRSAHTMTATPSFVAGVPAGGMSITPTGGPAFGNMSDALKGAITVPNLAALKAINTTGVVAGYSVRRAGYASAGDGGEALYSFSSSACSLNAGAGDNGTQVDPTTGPGCWIAPVGPLWVQVWGADPTGNADSTTALTYALNQGAGRRVLMPCGTYKVTSVLVTVNQPQLQGMGQSCTSIVGTSTTAHTIQIAAGVNGYFLSDFTIDRSVVPTDGAGLDVEAGQFGTIERVLSQNSFYGFRLGPTSRSYCNLCQAQYNYADGFNFYDTSAAINVQWIMGHPLSQLNDGWGFYLNWAGNGSFNDTDPYFLFPNSYANTKGGYAFVGTAASAHNDLTMIGPVASSDNGNGFEFGRPGLNISISNIFAELCGQIAGGRTGTTAATHVGNGINFDTGGASNSAVTIVGGSLMNNSYAGLQTYTNTTLARLSVTGVDAHDNGLAGSNSYGFSLQAHATATVLSGDMAHNQATGLYLADSTVNANTAVAGAILTGNTTAACSTALTNKAGVIGSGC